MSWTQPICGSCWSERRPAPDQVRYALREEFRQDETCAFCGRPTREGIYVRADPAKVPFPREED